MKPVARILVIAVIFGLSLDAAHGEGPTGAVTCTSKVAPKTCTAASESFQLAQLFPSLQMIDIVIADPEAFRHMKEGAADPVAIKAADLHGYIR